MIPRTVNREKRIVLTTFGSLGDLHPFVALALELRRRGHHPVIASNNPHRPVVEAEGLEFHPVRPGIDSFGDETVLMEKVWKMRTGPEFLIRDMLMGNLADSYADLLAACDGADILVSHPITYAAPLVAEKMRDRGLAWASVVLSPTTILSAYDPPLFAPAPWLYPLRKLGPGFHRSLFRAVTLRVRPWGKAWHQLRSELGLPPVDADPVFQAHFSPQQVLVLHSKHLASQQPDWPPQAVQTGFAFYDRGGAEIALDPDLEKFMSKGDPPIVFTLGSAAVMNAGSFYDESAKAATLLGRRALLMIGREPKTRPTNLTRDILAVEYAPYSQVFPRAAVVVHQGGIGTTAQGLLAGKPMLVVPFGFDQPDNAARLTRLGVARTLPRSRYRAPAVARELKPLLNDPSYRVKSAEVARELQPACGVSSACDALESLLV